MTPPGIPGRHRRVRFIADLHIHSYLSRATSKDLDLEHLCRTAQRKGIAIVGTGDFTHPRWFAELQEKLVPAEPGLFALRDETERAASADVAARCRTPVRFMLSVEISSIYKSADRVRKVHNLVYAPDFDSAAKIASRLAAIGNIESDGRPILGLDSRDLLEVVLESSPDAYLVPAHVWTPWFSALGAQSGFDAIDECFRDLSRHIFAIETGLSSDPAMNWRLSSLDRYALVSNSDAHSPDKLGREANLFDCELSYFGIKSALSDRPEGFLGTVEFFPEEGKYHYDGHRECGVVLPPEEARRREGRCPVCGKQLTAGVMRRVAQLADRPEGFKPVQAKPFRSLVPLHEVIAEVLDATPASGKVRQAYERLLTRIGPEMAVLSEAPLEDVGREGPPLLGEALRRIRAGQVHVRPGFDGEYGVIRAFAEEERRTLLAQRAFSFVAPSPPGAAESAPAEVEPAQLVVERDRLGRPPAAHGSAPRSGGWLNEEQARAIMHGEGPLLLTAGPGTGKTWTIVQRIAHLVRSGRASARTVSAVTFTRKAKEELASRLAALLPTEGSQIQVTTFHAWALSLLREYPEPAELAPDFTVVDDATRRRLADEVEKQNAARLPKGSASRGRLADRIGWAKAHLLSPHEADADLAESYAAYERALRAASAIDFDDLVVYAVHLLERSPEALAFAHERCRWLFVDEYQDINAAQYRLVRVLAPGEANLCAVGDPDQAIYGFRGSNPGYFARFEADYPAASAVSLVRNYRSMAPILAAAAAVIERSEGRTARPLEPTTTSGAVVEHVVADDHRDEAEFIARSIERAVGGTSLEAMRGARAEPTTAALAFHEIAVLVRTLAQMEAVAAALIAANVPFQRAVDDPIVARPRVSEILSSLRLLYERADAALVAEAREVGQGVGKRSVSELCARLGAFGGADASWKGAADFCAMLARPFGTDVAAFLEAVPLLRETDVHLERQKVALLTLHASKGLEFALVFVAGCEDGLLPLTMFGRSSDIEEERRLLYVGMTRARERLVLTSAKKRVLAGRTLANAPCPFLRELPPSLVSKTEISSRRNERRQLSLF
jgi:DNA helicase-2/ATP-dependent DNA helicase PcrA